MLEDPACFIDTLDGHPPSETGGPVGDRLKAKYRAGIRGLSIQEKVTLFDAMISADEMVYSMLRSRIGHEFAESRPAEIILLDMISCAAACAEDLVESECTPHEESEVGRVILTWAYRGGWMNDAQENKLLAFVRQVIRDGQADERRAALDLPAEGLTNG